MKALKMILLAVFMLSSIAVYLPADATAKKTACRNSKKAVQLKKVKIKKARKIGTNKKQTIKVKKRSVLPQKDSGAIFVTSHKVLDIYIDEDIIGKAPLTVEAVRPGRHLVEAYSGRDIVFRKYVDVKKTDTVVIEINGKKDVAEEDPDFII
ncbi:MAG: hypothetical protein NTZ10_06620 [Candidatus Saganbacteria bacterium]|nr:hypothetical protein [Candidatus Saganbacteria bacterium]